MKSNLKIAACALAALACARLAAAPDEVSYSRQRLFSGFDGKTCKIQPSIATDGSSTVLLAWQNLLLTGLSCRIWMNCRFRHSTYFQWKSTESSISLPMLQQ